MIRMKTVLLLLTIVAGYTTTFAQTVSRLTLRDAIETAIKNNIPVQQAGLLTEREEINWQQARANLLPNLNGSFSYGWNQGRNIDPITNSYINQQLASSNLGISSNVILFAGLQLQNAIKQTHFAYEASKQEFEQSKNTLTLNVLLTYLLVLNNEDLLVISQNQLEVTRQQVDRLDIMVKEGAVGQFQLTDLKGQRSTDEMSIIANYNALQSAKLSLCQLLNIPYNKDLVLDRTEFLQPAGLYAQSADEVYAEALRSFAQVKAGDLRVKSFEKGVKVAKGDYYPVLSFGANFGSSYSSAATSSIPGSVVEVPTGEYVKISNQQFDVLTQQQNFSSSKLSYGNQLNNNRGSFYGFSLQVPLFNNFRVRNQVKLASLSLKNSTLENANIKRLLRQNIDQAHLNMTSTFDRYKALQEQLENYEISFKAAEIRFNNGVINSPEYLLVKNTYDRARVNSITAMYEYILRIKILDFYQAKLLW